jgi:putative endonuclease
MQTGATAERAVCGDLERLGYLILEQNWRRPWGEIDVIAEKDKVIHFVEVKAATRRDEGFEPFLRANGRKMHKVQRTAETWLATSSI